MKYLLLAGLLTLTLTNSALAQAGDSCATSPVAYRLPECAGKLQPAPGFDACETTTNAFRILECAGYTRSGQGSPASQPVANDASGVRLLDCARSNDKDWCRESQAQYQRESQKAPTYTSTRNVAYCLWTGCGGAFAVNRRESCQLRRAIIQQFRSSIDRADELSFANCIKAGY